MMDDIATRPLQERLKDAIRAALRDFETETGRRVIGIAVTVMDVTTLADPGQRLARGLEITLQPTPSDIEPW